MTKLLNDALVFFSLFGLGLSFYSYIIELSVEMDENYVASCDFSEHMSCTKAFKSEYGKGFGILGRLLGNDSVFNLPNSLYGILFYSFLATVGFSDSTFTTTIALGATVLSNCASVYFASILIFILKDLCVVCVTIYVINFINLILVYIKLGRLRQEEKLKQN
ncbi:hypothetical protein RI129_009419 [Pyrocoelia pectoralis]|uniref:vitamin-K-epoxide reductase (warfarin-sensitive) n=1 Tax=Pyrocoelia pectoralis TaxID=417401 RepID=A0AAN7V4L2_9COLE